MRGLLALLLGIVTVVQAAGSPDAPAQPHLLPSFRPPVLLSPTTLTKRQVLPNNSTKDSDGPPATPTSSGAKVEQAVSPDPVNPAPQAQSTPAPKPAATEPQPAPSPTPANATPTETTRPKPTSSTSKGTPTASPTPTPSPTTDPAEESAKPAPINGTILGIVLGSLAGFVGLSTLLYRWKSSMQRRKRKAASASVEAKPSPQFRLMEHDEKAEIALRESTPGQDSNAPLLTASGVPATVPSPLPFSPNQPATYSPNGDLSGPNSRPAGAGHPPSLHTSNYSDGSQNMAGTGAPDYAMGYATPDFASGYTASTPSMGPYAAATPPMGPYPGGRPNDYQGRVSLPSNNRFPQGAPDGRGVYYDGRKPPPQQAPGVAYGAPFPPIPMQAAYGNSPRVGPYRMQGEPPPPLSPYTMQPVRRMSPNFTGPYPGPQDPRYSRERQFRRSE